MLESWAIRCSHDEFYATGRHPSAVKREERTSMIGSDTAVLEIATSGTIRHSRSLSTKPLIDLSPDSSTRLQSNFEQQSDSGYGTFSVGRSLMHTGLDRTSVIHEEDPEQGAEELASCDSSTQSDTLDAITEVSDAESLDIRGGFLGPQAHCEDERRPWHFNRRSRHTYISPKNPPRTLQRFWCRIGSTDR